MVTATSFLVVFLFFALTGGPFYDTAAVSTSCSTISFFVVVAADGLGVVNVVNVVSVLRIFVLALQWWGPGARTGRLSLAPVF